MSDEEMMDLINLRFEADKRLQDWGDSRWNKHDFAGVHALLGLPRVIRIADITKDHTRLLEALTGSNGYTFYRMLLARKDVA